MFKVFLCSESSLSCRQVPDLDRPSKKQKKGRRQTETDDDGSGSDDKFMSHIIAQCKAKKQAIEAGWEVESGDGEAMDMRYDDREPPAVKQSKQDLGRCPQEHNDNPTDHDDDRDYQGENENPVSCLISTSGWADPSLRGPSSLPAR